MRKPMGALLAEGVDRNKPGERPGCHFRESPSSRRAWIEITNCSFASSKLSVALLAEGVDRNGIGAHDVKAFLRRPPRGGRG